MDGHFKRILIANNGLAAAKFLLSIRSNVSEGSGPLFYGMVSDDDLQSGSSYVSDLDYVLLVPSGPSSLNYGNVKLIVQLAAQYLCDAVWPGWGHASENYELAQELEAAGISWIGPSSESMRRLGDKVESLLQAQKCGVPCAPWSGENATCAAACGIYSEAGLVETCARIGYPVMLKASSGGGGRGIRRVDRPDDCVRLFRQVQAEVKDGIIFAMKCVVECRHVEIQIVGDGKGTCMALSGRDCSVQRRHQKLIEEGPPPFIPAETLEAMELAAERLCSSVAYGNAGTVEFLYHEKSGDFFFLEVNCRLQVEHPVTELLWGINLPQIQLEVAAGQVELTQVRGLDRVAEFRKKNGRKAIPLGRHVVACRVVAEDPLNKWLPSSGDVFEIKSPATAALAYFSLAASGSRIHQFSDTQFGHVFCMASGEGARENACNALREALTSLAVVGSVSTNLQFMTSVVLNSSSDFIRFGPPITSWLDTTFSKSTASLARLVSQELCMHSLLAVCAHLAMGAFRKADSEILKWVRRGHRPPHVPSTYSETLLCARERVEFVASRSGENCVDLCLGGVIIGVEWTVGASGKAVLKVANFPSVLVSVVTVSSTKLRVQVGRTAVWRLFHLEEDVTRVAAPMNGRLVRWLVSEGGMVKAGDRLCEIEAMKMISVVLARKAGNLEVKVREGVSFIEGDWLASVVSAGGGDTPGTSPTHERALDFSPDFPSGSNSSCSTLERQLDGYFSAFCEQHVVRAHLSAGEVVEKFINDEVRCSAWIPCERLGSDVEHIAAVSTAHDTDLLNAWRWRLALPARMKLIGKLVREPSFERKVLEALVSALDARLHAPLISQANELLNGPEGVSESDEGLPVQVPKDALTAKRAAAAAAGSFYIYDLPDLLEAAVKNAWANSPRGQLAPDLHTLVSCTPLALSEECGMVAWLVNMRMPECEARRAIFIGNDITWQAGTFSVNEDKTYLKASQLARELGIPRIFVACNSGARLGLCEAVQKNFRVEWKDPADPTMGFHYLYLLDADYCQIGEAVIATPLDHQTEGKIWKLSDILGSTDEHIGVENLMWSGAIAGESSRSYQETFTLTYVTGRTVGIGAYIARLCQRIIQKVDSPILLTGFQALNKLIGSEVYRSNDEIGGVGVMFRNGVSHLTVGSDEEGIRAVVRWLQFLPEHRGAGLPVYQEVADPADRELAPSEGGRSLVEGDETMFDKNSFVEVQSGWARSVIAGRARLGGIPIGVIVVETRQTHFFQPADPADPHSQSVARPQAGQVWYPDSAYKTAQAIMDFNHEGLPLMILANWRGFSGGQRDMFNEILKFGSFIVDALTEYKQPVFVYLPPKAELRGGAWVVVDSRINPTCIEMYADPTARGGVLEPSGITEIKFRTHALQDLMMRTHQVDEANKRESFNLLKPTLVQVANTFADMHDTPARMLHTGAIRAIVDWKHSRKFFCSRLQQRLNIG